MAASAHVQALDPEPDPELDAFLSLGAPAKTHLPRTQMRSILQSVSLPQPSPTAPTPADPPAPLAPLAPLAPMPLPAAPLAPLAPLQAFHPAGGHSWCSW